jgi:hypothetical protein
MERLEDRQLMAGDIAVSFSNGLLSITEASGHEGEDNTVAVSMEANGNLRVVGGGVDQQFRAADVENIDILLGRGSDTLVFQADLTEPGIPNYGTQVFINMGLADFGDIDQVEILNTDIEGLVQVIGGWADDTVYVHNTTILGDGLIVNTGSGSDVVAVVDCNLSGLAIQTYDDHAGYPESETHRDRVEIYNLNLNADPIGLVQVRTGGGDDYFALDDVNAVRVDIDSGSGDDAGYLIDVAAVDEIFIRMGDGDDQLLYDGIVADRLTAFGGGGTNDKLWTRFESERNLITTRGHSGWEHLNVPMRATLTHAAVITKNEITKNTVTKKMVQTTKFVP